MSIINNLLTTTASNIYVSSGNSVVSTMYFCNTYTAAVYLNVYIVPAANVGLPVTIANQIYSNIQLASNDTYVADWEKISLGAGDMIKANVSLTSQPSVCSSVVSYIGI